MPNSPINARRAQQLKIPGRSWRVVGMMLAKEEGRAVPYKMTSVYMAVYRLKTRLNKPPARRGRSPSSVADEKENFVIPPDDDPLLTRLQQVHARQKG